MNDKDEADAMIKHLKVNPEELRKLSGGASELGKSFDWKNLGGVWDAEIEKIYHRK